MGTDDAVRNLVEEVLELDVGSVSHTVDSCTSVCEGATGSVAAVATLGLCGGLCDKALEMIKDGVLTPSQGFMDNVVQKVEIDVLTEVGNLQDISKGNVAEVSLLLLETLVSSDASLEVCVQACGSAPYVGMVFTIMGICDDICERSQELIAEEIANPSDNFTEKVLEEMEDLVNDKIEEFSDPQTACNTVCTNAGEHYLGWFGECCAEDICVDNVCPVVAENIDIAVA